MSSRTEELYIAQNFLVYTLESSVTESVEREIGFILRVRSRQFGVTLDSTYQRSEFEIIRDNESHEFR